MSTAQDDSSDQSVAAQNAAGASGSDDGYSGLSTTGMAILITVVCVVVILGVASAFLYLIAKRRQWRIREKIRRSARRVGEAIRTPLTPRFSKSARSPLPQSARDRRTSHRDGVSVLSPVKEESHNERLKSYKKVDSSTVRTEAYRKTMPRKDTDLEKGQELQSIKTTSVEVTAKDSSSVESNPAPARKGWGTMFSFGRQ